MPLATLWWGEVSTSLQHCLQQLLQLFIWDWRGAQMVLPEQAERKTACTFPAGEIPPGKATPAEITALLTASCHCHFSPAQHTKVTISEKCLHPDVCPNTLSLHSLFAPTTARKDMPVHILACSYVSRWGTEWQSHHSRSMSLPGTPGLCCSILLPTTASLPWQRFKVGGKPALLCPRLSQPEVPLQSTLTHTATGEP